MSTTTINPADEDSAARSHPALAGLDDAAAAVQAARSSAVWSLSDDDLATALADCESVGTVGDDTAGPADTSMGAADWAASAGAPPGREAMPATGAGLRAGTISADHAEVITRTLGRIPSWIDDAEVAEAETELAGWAREHDPATLDRLGRYLLYVMDPDGTAPGEDDETRRELRINDDTGTIRGRLDREGLAQLRAALDPLAAPCPAADGTPDPRPAPRRVADALVELARRACDHGDLPTTRGARPHLALFADLDTLRRDGPGHDNNGGTGTHSASSTDSRSGAPGNGRASGVAPGELFFGGPISPEAVRRTACDAGVSRIITDPAGVPLDVGREHRTVTPGQFTALTARDGGGAFPSCTRPPSWCESHHIQHWADGGVTSVDNMVLVCGHHHRAIHHRGWNVRLAPDRLPEFVPPAWVDPHQTPQPNNRPRYHRKRSP